MIPDRLRLLFTVACACGAALPACHEEHAAAPAGSSAAIATTVEPTPTTADSRAAPMRPPTPHYLLVGAAGSPSMYQVSIEQDLSLAASVLGDDALVLFGSGPGFAGVQELSPRRSTHAREGDDDELRAKLADLFAPRPDRAARYRPTHLRPHAPATRERLLAEVSAALRQPGAPLLVYIAGHGDIGEQARQNGIGTWENGFLTVADLATALDATVAARPLRIVVTTCFAGGFAELAFRNADESAGASDQDRCGLFATTWDLSAAGCDPNPDRRGQESYALHLLNALARRDRDGRRPLAPAEVDFDGDGHVSLLEAHTRARIAMSTPDVPTTTSERWLRHAVPAETRLTRPALALSEEQAVVAALSQKLGLAASPEAARDELEAMEEAATELQEQLTAADTDLTRAADRAAAALLGRWPVLDDPWHPDFARALGESRGDLARFFAGSPDYAAYEKAAERSALLDERLWQVRERAAPYERLVRALDNERLAGELKARGGEAWRRYERLLRCERSAP